MTGLWQWVLAVGILAVALPEAQAQTIYPIDGAQILKGAKFDFKVEFDGAPPAADVSVTIDGKPATDTLGGPVEIIETEEGHPITALWVRSASIAAPGSHVVEAGAAGAKAVVTWNVFETPSEAKAKNVILFIGDGMSIAHRTAARMLSKGIKQGRYGGELAMDELDHMALVSTAGMDSIITDSANSMSTYTTGHKTCVGAMGVYCASHDFNWRHPKVENLSELVKRKTQKATGVVTNTEIEDATPAAMVAHTRSRRDFDDIVRMFYEAKPEVILGGGSGNFDPLPSSPTGSPTRRDNQDYLEKFKALGYAHITTSSDLAAAAAKPETTRLLGLFNTGNIDGALDRKFLHPRSIGTFTDQPDLTDELRAALQVLKRNDDGFLLMVESGRIDKYSHSLDWERAVYDTIMLDNAVQIARDFAADRNDTLIIVVADHAHPVSLVGVYDDTSNQPLIRDRTKTYAEAGFPNYPAAGSEGYPATADVTRRLALMFAAYPDTCMTGKAHLDGENVPLAKPGTCVPADAFRPGNLPQGEDKGVHAGDDVILTASGPGAEMFRGHIDNTYVFRVIATALGLGR